ncbi:MAG TPA: ABC transporter permease [Beijerinckiaceae bacterium]
MPELLQALRLATHLVISGDPELAGVVSLSLRVSLTATALAFLVGAPLGAALAVARFRGRRAAIVLVNTLLGLPPVVVGLLVYLLLSRSGPLGNFGLLFTPGAMILAQAVLGLPIIAALTHRALSALWRDYGDALSIDGASRWRAAYELLRMGRAALVTAFLAGFGRAIAEVGAILIVGGNIRGATRTMTTSIALETSKGDLPLALALGLILVSLSLLVSTLVLSLERRAPDS